MDEMRKVDICQGTKTNSAIAIFQASISADLSVLPGDLILDVIYCPEVAPLQCRYLQVAGAAQGILSIHP